MANIEKAGRKVSEMVQKGINYVKEKKSWSEAADKEALDTIQHYRCDIGFADSKIETEIIDLMEEFGQENDLPEGWWTDEVTADDIFFAL